MMEAMHAATLAANDVGELNQWELLKPHYSADHYEKIRQQDLEALWNRMGTIVNGTIVNGSNSVVTCLAGSALSTTANTITKPKQSGR